MRNRISELQDVRGRCDDGPQPIGAILAELLAQYEARFPEAHISVVQTPATVPMLMEDDHHACACST